MYEMRSKKHGIIAVGFYIIMFVGYLLMGIMYKNGVQYYSLISWILFGIVIVTVLIVDKNIVGLGFLKEKVKRNLLISCIIVIISLCVAFIFSEYSAFRIFKRAVYYLFYIAMMEEIIFRGFIQNYLFGFKINKYIIFIVGALMFSLMHIPFQMYVNDMVQLSYFLTAAPQLGFTFLFHFLMCYVTYKSKDILISTSVHFAVDFIQAVIL